MPRPEDVEEMKASFLGNTLLAHCIGEHQCDPYVRIMIGKIADMRNIDRIVSPYPIPRSDDPFDQWVTEETHNFLARSYRWDGQKFDGVDNDTYRAARRKVLHAVFQYGKDFVFGSKYPETKWSLAPYLP